MCSSLVRLFQPKLYTDVLTQFARGAKWRSISSAGHAKWRFDSIVGHAKWRFDFKRRPANWRFDLCATPSSSAASSASRNADKLASHIRIGIGKYADIVKQAHIKID
jgi:hypothetical protein